jgi:hypothetical protein
VLCTDRLVDSVKNHADQEHEINIHEHLKRFTMNTIWNCAFGVDIDLQDDPENIYLKKCEEVFDKTSNLNMIQYSGSMGFKNFTWLNY